MIDCLREAGGPRGLGGGAREAASSNHGGGAGGAQSEVGSSHESRHTGAAIASPPGQCLSESRSALGRCGIEKRFERVT